MFIKLGFLEWAWYRYMLCSVSNSEDALKNHVQFKWVVGMRHCTLKTPFTCNRTGKYIISYYQKCSFLTGHHFTLDITWCLLTCGFSASLKTTFSQGKPFKSATVPAQMRKKGTGRKTLQKPCARDLLLKCTNGRNVSGWKRLGSQHHYFLASCHARSYMPYTHTKQKITNAYKYRIKIKKIK